MIDINEIRGGRLSNTEKVFYTFMDYKKLDYQFRCFNNSRKYIRILRDGESIMVVLRSNIIIDIDTAFTITGCKERKDYNDFIYDDISVHVIDNKGFQNFIKSSASQFDKILDIDDIFDSFEKFLEQCSSLKFWND